MRLRSAIGVALALVLTGLAAAVWLGSHMAFYPPWYAYPRPPGTDPRRALGLDFEDVSFAAVDGATLRGWWVPAAAPAVRGVVMVHGAGGDRTDLLHETGLFHDAGYPVLLFDQREHGESDGAGRGLGLAQRESRDVSSAVAFARSDRGLCRVAVYGASQGGAAVVLAAARDPGIDAVIAEAPWARLGRLMHYHSPAGSPRWMTDAVRAVALWRLGYAGAPDPEDVVAQIAPRPLLLIHGTEDPAVPPSESRALRAAAGEGAELWIVDGAGHHDSYERHPRRFAEKALGLLARGLGGGCPD